MIWPEFMPVFPSSFFITTASLFISVLTFNIFFLLSLSDCYAFLGPGQPIFLFLCTSYSVPFLRSLWGSVHCLLSLISIHIPSHTVMNPDCMHVGLAEFCEFYSSTIVSETRPSFLWWRKLHNYGFMLCAGLPVVISTSIYSPRNQFLRAVFSDCSHGYVPHNICLRWTHMHMSVIPWDYWHDKFPSRSPCNIPMQCLTEPWPH